jgi:hypothetical protein
MYRASGALQVAARAIGSFGPSTAAAIAADTGGKNSARVIRLGLRGKNQPCRPFTRAAGPFGVASWLVGA